MQFKVKELRIMRKMTQEDLAKKSGISRATISAFETGSVKITTTDTLIKLANALDSTVGEIFLPDLPSAQDTPLSATRPAP